MEISFLSGHSGLCGDLAGMTVPAGNTHTDADAPGVVRNIGCVIYSANICKGKFETSEVQCIGAALHGKFLAQQVQSLRCNYSIKKFMSLIIETLDSISLIPEVYNLC